MTDEETPLQPTTAIDPADPGIIDVYSNFTLAAFSPSDISITFGHQVDPRSGGLIKPRVRVTMTHQGFMDAMAFLNTRYHFLQRMYKDHAPTLLTIDPEEGKAALDDMEKEYRETI